MPVHLRMTKHGGKRARDRTGRAPRKVARRVAGKLKEALQMGARVDKNLGIKIELGDDMVAICEPSARGGWAIVTVRPDREKEGSENEAKASNISAY